MTPSAEENSKYDLKTIDDVLKIVASFVRRDGRVIKMFLIALAFDVLVTGAIGIGAFELHALTQTQEKNTCVSGNAVRANEQKLWTFVFDKIEPPNPTIRQALEFAAFNHEVHKDLKLRNCTALYG